MKKILICATALLLSACGASNGGVRSAGDLGPAVNANGEDAIDQIPAVKPVQIPELTGRYAQKAGPLPPLSGTDFKSQQNDAVEADRQYNDVADRLNTVIDVYNCVREAVNNKRTDDLQSCLK